MTSVADSSSCTSVRSDRDFLLNLVSGLRRQIEQIEQVVLGLPATPYESVPASDERLSPATIAKIKRKSKDAIVKQARRQGILEKQDGRLFIRASSLARLYPNDGASSLSSTTSSLSDCTASR